MRTARAVPGRHPREWRHVMLRTIVIILLILLILGALPTWPHSQGWGYYPSGGLVILLIVIVLITRGRS
jgi:Protein of unknown function (DUF3309)